MRLGLLASWIAFWFYSAANAAPLDLASAVKESLNSSPAVREATEKVNQYRQQKRLAISSMFANIDLSVTSTYRKDSVADKSSVPFDGDPYNIYGAGLKGEQTLYRYGSFSAISKEQYQSEIGVKELEIVRRDLTGEVIRIFYKAILNEKLVRLLEDEEKSVREILLIAQRRLGIGGRRIDVLQVRTRLALLRPKIEKARNERAFSTAELARLIGRSDESEIQISGQIPILDMKKVEQHMNLKEFDILELEKIRLQRAQLEQQKAVAFGKNMPQLKVVGDYSFLNYTKSELFDGASKFWSVQLLLTVPIFSGLSSISERRILVSQDAQFESQERNVFNSVQLAQIKSRKELASAQASLESAGEGVKLARESVVEARREYRVGLMDFLQIFQVESANFEAEMSYLQLRYDVINSYYNFFVASGQPISILVDLLSEYGEK